MIANIIQKVKPSRIRSTAPLAEEKLTLLYWVKLHQRSLWQASCLVLVGWAAYNLGQIYAPGGFLEASSKGTEQGTAKLLKPLPSKPVIDKSDPRVVASKTSKSKKYHYSWCSSSKRIKEANQLWFDSSATAEASGYSLAGNCTP